MRRQPAALVGQLRHEPDDMSKTRILNLVKMKKANTEQGDKNE